MYEATGTIKVIQDLQTFSSGFSKREFVVTTQESKYPQDIKFETVKDKTSMLDSFKVGDNVTVSFDIRGNEYNGKYYVNLNCWRIQAGAASSVSNTSSSSYDIGNAIDEEPSMDELRSSEPPF